MKEIKRPIAFASQTLTKTEKGYSQIDKEALTIFWGFSKLHDCLFVWLTFHTVH